MLIFTAAFLPPSPTQSPSETVEPAPQQQHQQHQQHQQQLPSLPPQPPSRSGTPMTASSALAQTGDRAPPATHALTRSHSGSIKKVVELWHGWHNHQHASSAGGERASIIDSSTAASTAAANPGAPGTEGGGIEALLPASHRHLRAPADDDTKELLAIINPAAESLCQALAHGHEWTAQRRWRRRRWRKDGDGDGDGNGDGDGDGDGDGPQEQQPEGGEEGGADGVEGDEDEKGPLPLDALPPEALDELPHNRWLALPLHKAGAAGRGPTGAATYEIDMPMIPGPAVVFFYSPYGRLRLRGVLRDDGAEPILED